MDQKQPVRSAQAGSFELHLNFNPLSLELFTKLMSSSKLTNCLLDPLPAKLFKDLQPIIGPHHWINVINIINKSVVSGQVSAALNKQSY